MFAKIANEFENITKFPLLQYFKDFRDFLQEDYQDVYNYYSGISEDINSDKINKIKNLLKRSDDLVKSFQSFVGKLGNVGYWELQQYCQDLKDTLERIQKFPKYLKTSKSCRGYKPYIQVNENIGGMRTIEDISTSSGISGNEMIFNNDLEEEDWRINELSQIKVFIDNKNDIVVNTIIEQPIGKRIYGKDIKRKISFSNNDLDIVKYEENIDQKSEVLLELIKGDIPEFPTLGKDVDSISGSYSSFNYAALVSDIQDSFMQDDLFEKVEISDIKIEDNKVIATCNIQTKYVYSTTKSVKI